MFIFSFEEELQRIKEEIIAQLPADINVQKIEFEGPEIAVYSENTDVEATESSTILKDLAKNMRKRVVFRWNVDKRKDPAETEEYPGITPVTALSIDKLPAAKVPQLPAKVVSGTVGSVEVEAC